MNVIIAHASKSENNTAKGKAGDQTKREVCTRSYYNKQWDCVIRFKDTKMAEKAAKCMKMACENDNIGYDQPTRNTLLNECRKYNYDVSKVAKPVNTDCSALVSVACMYAGIPESTLTLKGNCATTRTLKNILKSTGLVDIFTTALYTTKPDKLKIGDILLKEGNHVVMVVGVDVIPYKLTSKLMKKGSVGESVKWLQFVLNHNGAKLEIDGQFGAKTELAVLLYQKDRNLKADGIVGEKTIKSLQESLKTIKLK